MSKRGKVILRLAKTEDFVKIFGQASYQPWYAIVADDGRLIHGIGGVMAFDGRWFAFFKRTPGCRSKLLMHKAAKMLFDDLAKEKQIVYAIPQRGIKGSAKYLKRLGFFRTPERVLSGSKEIAVGEKVWVKHWRR